MEHSLRRERRRVYEPRKSVAVVEVEVVVS